MAPADSKQPQLKQKTLLGFFNRVSSTSPPTEGAHSKSEAQKVKVSNNRKTTIKKKIAKITGNESQARDKGDRNLLFSNDRPKSLEFSSPRRSIIETPPTSDPVDIEMLSDLTDDDDGQIVPTTKKRKKTVVHSDEDAVEVQSLFKGFSAANSSESPRDQEVTVSRIKRARTSTFSISEEVSETEERSHRFRDKFAEFRQARSSGCRRSSGTANYTISGNEEDVALNKHDRKARSQSNASSARSRKSASSFDDDFIAPSESEVLCSGAIDVDAPSESDSKDLPKKSRYKSGDESEKTVMRPVIKGKANVSQESGQKFLLTAAEQRALEKKADKKEKEDAFPFLLDIQDKDKNRPGDPDYDPRTLYIHTGAWKTFTPFEKQFWEIKQNHFDTILFFQKGKFLELYEDDARIGNRLFDLKLTRRVKMSMVGVPEMSFSFWAAKFLAKGYKVGRVDQAETALGAEMRRTADKSTGDKLVRRELNKVYTNGTLVDGDLLMDDEASHCISIRESSNGKTFGICVLDSATSQFDLTAFEDDICRTKLETTIRQLRVKEIIFTKGNLSVSTTRLFRNILDGSCLWTGLRRSEGLNYDQTLDELKIMFPGDENNTDEGAVFPEVIKSMISDKDAIEALGAMIWYLRQLNIDKDLLSMKNFNIYDPMRQGKGLVLDGQTLAHIEVLVNSEGTTEGTLLSLLGRCTTPFGKRLFRLWLCMPLRDVKQIQVRQDAVQDLIEHPIFEADFTKLVKGMPDLERMVSRIHAKNCKVRDFLKVLECFKKLNNGLAQLADSTESFSSNSVHGLLRSGPDLGTHLENIESMFQVPKNASTDELLPCEGKSEKYDEIEGRICKLESKLDDGLKRLEKSLNMKLKYWHSAQGTKEIYQVETLASQKDIPKDWTKTGNTKATKRWSVPAFVKTIRELQMAREERNGAVKEYKYRIFAEFDVDRAIWLRMVKTVAELDCLFSLAKSSIAIGEPACRPTFTESEFASIDFEELRHPALSVKGDFIPNNVCLGGLVGRIALLTGPNMAGKSTLMRMTAAGIIMAQLGMLVPARKAKISPVDSILTRMGAYDNMFSNSSTFKVELDECCKILRNATPKSLVILDELGRGTSTYDGMAIAEAVLHHLATHTLALSCFATHYSSLTGDFSHHPNIRNMHMQTMVDDEKRELLFLYKLVAGVATGSFGTHVANLAGVPIDVVTRAEVISKDFAKKFNEKQAQKMKTTNIPVMLQADFAYLVKVAKTELSLDSQSGKATETFRILKQFVKNQSL